MSLGLILALVVGGLLLVTVGFELLRMLAAGLRGDRSRRDGLVLRTTLLGTHPPAVDEPGFTSAPARLAALVGQQGCALTDLRPAGKARIGDATCDVVSRTDYIERGEALIVVQVEGARVVVDRPGAR